jgi:hypothetical protein
MNKSGFNNIRFSVEFWVSAGLAVIIALATPFLTKDAVVSILGDKILVIVVFFLLGWSIVLLVRLKKKDTTISEMDYERIITTIHPNFQTYAKFRLDEIKRFIDGFKSKRTGRLPRFDYYHHLNDNVNLVVKGDAIWACSTFLENEWNSNDDDERTLMRNFRRADERGVETQRIFIFRNERLLKPNAPVPGADISDSDFPEDYYTIKNLLPYLKGEVYKCTRSFAIGKTEYEQLTDKQKSLLGDGFCAFYRKMTDDTFFFYDTPTDEAEKRLGDGEILFDTDIIREIKELFDMIVGSKRELKDYIFDQGNANENARTYLSNNGIKPSQQPET